MSDRERAAVFAQFGDCQQQVASLTEERDRLKAENKRLKKSLAHWQDCHGVTADKLEEAESENTKLLNDWREQDVALQEIWGALGIDGDPTSSVDIVRRVKAALSEPQG